MIRLDQDPHEHLVRRAVATLVQKGWSRVGVRAVSQATKLSEQSAYNTLVAMSASVDADIRMRFEVCCEACIHDGVGVANAVAEFDTLAAAKAASIGPCFQHEGDTRTPSLDQIVAYARATDTYRDALRAHEVDPEPPAGTEPSGAEMLTQVDEALRDKAGPITYITNHGNMTMAGNADQRSYSMQGNDQQMQVDSPSARQVGKSAIAVETVPAPSSPKRHAWWVVLGVVILGVIAFAADIAGLYDFAQQKMD